VCQVVTPELCATIQYRVPSLVSDRCLRSAICSVHLSFIAAISNDRFFAARNSRRLSFCSRYS
jgi:hypothetical protein